ncbi:MAG: TRAP transporter substrate-binding protein DctP [Verrucomicrobia bacterium]|nr:TRAP transporter substrate-binding protein DctP [Verrucomicrobiota bacterium]
MSRKPTASFWVMAAALALALPAARAQNVVIKLATLAPEGSSWHLILKEMGEEWKKVSNGRVTLKIYPGGVVGDEAEMVSKMRLGTIHAAAVTGTGLSEIDRGVQALQVPMLYRSDAELDHVRARMTPTLEKRLGEKGFVVLTWGEAGWVHFFTKSPVVRPDDLKKLKLFTWAGDTLVLDLWKAGGFNPVPLASTDIMPSLQTGMINAFATPPVAALSFQWYSLAPNMTDMRWAPLIGATVLDKRSWQRIPADARDAIMAVSRKAGEKLQADVRRGELEAVKAMKDHKLNVVPVVGDAMTAWRSAAEAIYPKLRGPFVPADMFDEAQRIVTEFRSKGAAGAN